MSAAMHILLFLVYSAFSAAVALALPSELSDRALIEVSIGFSLFALAFTQHQIWAKTQKDQQRERSFAFKDRIDVLYDDSDKLAHELRALRTENHGLFENLNQAARRSIEQRVREAEIERKAMQDLKTQLSAASAVDQKLSKELETLREESRVLRENLKTVLAGNAKATAAPREMASATASESASMPGHDLASPHPPGDGGELDDEHVETEAERRVLRDLKKQIAEIQADSGVVERRPVDFSVLDEDQSRPLGFTDATILNIVREGIRNDRIDLFLQPVVTLPQRRPRYYECYSRIRAADGAMILPAQYIELARDHGLLRAIDNVLLFRCVQLVRKAQRHNHDLGFFCNISMQTLSDRSFFPQFISFMEENRSLASRLTFELAEEDVDSQWKFIDGDMAHLSRFGFRFSMDRVRNMGLDPSLMASRHFKFVKIDVNTLLARARANRRNMRVFKNELDRNGIDLIVEKVETQEQLVELLDLGIYFAQGFLFGEPRLSRKD